MPTKVIQPYFSGLGDHLQFSTLARRFTEIGYDVFLSDKCTFRNKDIKKLVWDKNPYIKGVTNLDADCGDSEVAYENAGIGFIGNWEKLHGLTEPYSKYPEVYYTPKNIEGLNNSVIVDFSCVSLHKEYAKYDTAKLIPDNAMLIDFKQKVIDGEDYIQIKPDGRSVYYCYDIFDYCDVLASCKQLLCFFSGAAVLASALQKYRKFDVDCFYPNCYQMKNAEVTDLYFFDNINYHEL